MKRLIFLVLITSRCAFAQTVTNTFPSTGAAGVGTTSPQLSFEIVGWGQVIRNTGSTSYSTLRLYNEKNDAMRALEIDYSSSAYPGSLITGGPGGESAAIATTGAYPLVLGTANTARMTIMDNGNVGIGTSAPLTNLHVGNTNGGGIRIGAVNDAGNYVVPLGAQTNQYNLDFSGYRDVMPDQIGARIAALRFNVYGNNVAYVQTTGLAFYTNPSGYIAGTGGLQERMRIAPDGNVGIGTSSPGGFKLAVEGKIGAREVNVTATTPWPDYVFEKDYNLPSLDSVKTYIDQHKHLPEIPSAKEMEANGVNLGEMNMMLLKKVEELTLYMIEQNKNDLLQKEQIKNLISEVEKLKQK